MGRENEHDSDRSGKRHKEDKSLQWRSLVPDSFKLVQEVRWATRATTPVTSAIKSRSVMESGRR